MKRIFKKLSLVILAFLVLYGSLIKFPQILFPYSISYKNINIYSNTNISSSIYSLIDTVNSKLRQSEFFTKKITHNIFICNNQLLYSILSYPSKSTFAGNNILTGNILIAKADIDNNQSYRLMDDKSRELSNLMTHEITHSLLYNYLGFRNYFKLPKWKNEGYCDFIAKSSTLDRKTEIESICAGKNEKSYSYYRLAIEYIMEGKKLSMKEIIKQNFDYNKIIEKVKLKYCA